MTRWADPYWERKDRIARNQRAACWLARIALAAAALAGAWVLM